MTHWQGTRVIIIGAARQGLALARYLASHGADVVINDQRPESEFIAIRESNSDISVEWVFGNHPLSLLDNADVVCPSGGVPLSIPLIVEAQNRGIPLSNDSEIFLEDVSCKVIGITGSAGKSTTTTLVGRMAIEVQRMGNPDLVKNVWVGGNIGSPLIGFVDEIKPGDIAIMELSSFQLEVMNRSPQIAAVLNITPNHLDRHKTMDAYTAAKSRILDYQSTDDIAVLGYDDPGAWGLFNAAKGRVVGFGLNKPLVEIPCVYLREGQIILNHNSDEIELFSKKTISLRGEHNLLNVLAACAIAFAADLPSSSMVAGVKGFYGMPHRLEYIRSWHGADWYNDSIATAPERVIAAIKSFDEPLVLLAGGRDKQLPWGDFVTQVRHRVDHLVLFGETADNIAQYIQEDQLRNPRLRRPYTISCCSGLKEAVESAAQLVDEGDVVLLSPGGTSFDEFQDFEARGEEYKKWVEALP